MNTKMKKKIEAATVRLTKLGGRGVLVSNGFILTAAHCIGWSAKGGMVLGDYYLEPIRTSAGKNLIGSVYCVEPVTDIAVLGPPDNQEFYKDFEKYSKFIDETEGVSLSNREEFEFGEFFPAWILSKRKAWFKVEVARFGLDLVGTLFMRSKTGICAGDSGSPVVDSNGTLLGVVSHAAESARKGEIVTGTIPWVRTALPTWVLHRIIPPRN